MKPLPSSYSNLPPCGPIRKDCIVFNVKFSLSVDSNIIPDAMAMEYSWLNKVSVATEQDEVPPGDYYTWAGHHADILAEPWHSSTSLLLPLFRDAAHSTAMICHAMSIVNSIVQCLNPGLWQSKQIQWN